MANNRKKEEYPLSRPSLKIKALLSSTSAHKLYQQNFLAVSRHLYNITTMTRVVGNNDAAQKAEVEITKIFDSCQRELDGEISRLKKILADNSIEGTPGYEVTKEYEVEIITPYASQFLSLIKADDKVNSLIDTVHLVGILSKDQQMSGVYRYEQRVRKAANKIREMGNILKAYAKAQSSGQEMNDEEIKVLHKISGESNSKPANVAAA